MTSVLSGHPRLRSALGYLQYGLSRWAIAAVGIALGIIPLVILGELVGGDANLLVFVDFAPVLLTIGVVITWTTPFVLGAARRLTSTAWPNPADPTSWKDRARVFTLRWALVAVSALLGVVVLTMIDGPGNMTVLTPMDVVMGIVLLVAASWPGAVLLGYVDEPSRRARRA